MLKRIRTRILGYRTITVEATDLPRALNLLRDTGLSPENPRSTPEGGLSFTMTERAAEMYRMVCESEGIRVICSDARGLPASLRRLRGRWGIAVGALLAVLIVWQSCEVVWEIEITGNTTVEASEILETLREVGFTLGTRHRGIDFDLLQNRFLMQSENIAWIAVNMQGNRAHVEVREKRSGRGSEATGVCANIVAAEDGQIMEVRVKSGRAEVGVGDVVRKGDLLISGVIAVGEDGVRFEYAAGEVLARLNRTVVGEAYAVREEKRYSEPICVEKSIIFFGKEIKFFRKSGIAVPTYDTIILDTPITLPDGTSLPLSVRTTEVHPYTVESRHYSEDETAAEAERLYHVSLSQMLEGAELLSLDVEREASDGRFTVTGHAVCVADIARTSDVYIEGTEGNSREN